MTILFNVTLLFSQNFITKTFPVIWLKHLLLIVLNFIKDFEFKFKVMIPFIFAKSVDSLQVIIWLVNIILKLAY